MQNMSLKRERLIKRAETVLRPSLAILLECAFEAERNEKAAEYLEELVGKFYKCAKEAAPLSEGKHEVFDMYLPTEDADLMAVGLLSDDTVAAETVFACSMHPETDGFIREVSERAIGAGLSKLAPIVLGVGIADDENEARLLARLALFRSPDRHSPDAETMKCERRILATINRDGPGAGGFGGGHTALAVLLEQTGTGYVALCPGSYFTRFASEKL